MAGDLRRAARSGRAALAGAGDRRRADRGLPLPAQVEHRLQMVADQQTHTLPARPRPARGFAAFMGYRRSAARLWKALRDHAASGSSATMRRCSRAARPRRPAATSCSPAPTTTRRRWRRSPAWALPRPVADRRADPRLASRPYPRHASARARELLTELMPRLLRRWPTSPSPTRLSAASTSS